MKLTIGILSKKQTLALFKPGSAKYKAIESSDKEYYTDREIEDLMELRPAFPAGTIGGYRSGAPGSDAGLADDDKVQSYDNNLDLWR